MDNDSDYNVLLNGILNTPILCDEIQKLQNRTSAVNLIKKSWVEDLEKHPVYEAHKSKKVKYTQGHVCGIEKKAYVRNIFERNQIYNVIVAGEWMLQKSEKDNNISIVSKNCKPLNIIGLSMQEDETKKLHSGGRFFVKICHPLFCHYCREYHETHNIPIAPKNWCVLSLKIFDGQTIRNISTTELQYALFQLRSFMGILHLEISSRTTFGDCSYKICGVVNYMIVFQSLCLNSKNLYSLPNSSKLAIEYTKESIDDELEKNQ